MDTVWKNSWWVAQVLDGHIGEQIVNRIKGLFHKAPSGHIEVWIVKEIKGDFYKVLPGHFVETPIHSLQSILKDGNMPKDGQIVLEQH